MQDNMGTKDTTQIIEDNIELLRDIHANNYIGTNDEMIENFEHWVSGFSYDELVVLVSKAGNWLDDMVLDTIDYVENEAPLQKLKRLTNYEDN
jgi:hypothetical protein